MAAWFEVGSADRSNLLAATRINRAAQQAGITTRIVVVPGASHTWHLWRRAFADALPWAVTQMEQPTLGTGAAAGGRARMPGS
jgi:S-formylglutathione hydrolase FrmB